MHFCSFLRQHRAGFVRCCLNLRRHSKVLSTRKEYKFNRLYIKVDQNLIIKKISKFPLSILRFTSFRKLCANCKKSPEGKTSALRKSLRLFEILCADIAQHISFLYKLKSSQNFLFGSLNNLHKYVRQYKHIYKFYCCRRMQVSLPNSYLLYIPESANSFDVE